MPCVKAEPDGWAKARSLAVISAFTVTVVGAVVIVALHTHSYFAKQDELEAVKTQLEVQVKCINEYAIEMLDLERQRMEAYAFYINSKVNQIGAEIEVRFPGVGDETLEGLKHKQSELWGKVTLLETQINELMKRRYNYCSSAINKQEGTE